MSPSPEGVKRNPNYGKPKVGCNCNVGMWCRHLNRLKDEADLKKNIKKVATEQKPKTKANTKGKATAKTNAKGKGKGKANAQPAKTGKYKADNDVEMLREELMAMSKTYFNLAKKYNNLDWRHRQLAKIVDQHDHKLGFKLGMNVES